MSSPARSGFSVEARRYGDPDAARLIAEVQEEYVARYGGPDGAAVDPAEFEPPGGLFLVGLLDGVPVASGGWRRSDADAGDAKTTTAEIKRMYVGKEFRRLGLARRLLAELEATARAAGISRLVLNTGRAQPEAIAFYERAGYTAIAPFGHYAETRGALFYGKELG